MYLFFDTETTGLPKDWKAPLIQLNNWPRMVQLAWLVYDESGQELDRQDFIIRPTNFRIPKQASLVHGITTEKALAEGHDLTKVLTVFATAIGRAEYLIAHNIDFDNKIAGAEFLRLNVPNVLFDRPNICTMKSSLNYLKLPGKYRKYKNPSLTQLYTYLFGKGFDNAHDALADVIACADSFFELKKRGIIA